MSNMEQRIWVINIWVNMYNHVYRRPIIYGQHMGNMANMGRCIWVINYPTRAPTWGNLYG